MRGSIRDGDADGPEERSGVVTVGVVDCETTSVDPGINCEPSGCIGSGCADGWSSGICGEEAMAGDGASEGEIIVLFEVWVGTGDPVTTGSWF